MTNWCHLCRGSVKHPMWATRAPEISASLSVRDNYLYVLVSLFCSRCLFGGRTFTLISDSNFLCHKNVNLPVWISAVGSHSSPQDFFLWCWQSVPPAQQPHTARVPTCNTQTHPTKRSHLTTGSISLMLFVFFICFYGSNYPSKDTAKWIRWQGSQFCTHHHTKQWSQVHYWITPTFPHLHFTCRTSRYNKGLQAPRQQFILTF